MRIHKKSYSRGAKKSVLKKVRPMTIMIKIRFKRVNTIVIFSCLKAKGMK